MAKKKTATRSSAVPYAPAYGEIVEVELVEGFRVRDPRSAQPLKTGDRVTFGTYFRRRGREGALRFSPVPARTETEEPSE